MRPTPSQGQRGDSGTERRADEGESGMWVRVVKRAVASSCRPQQVIRMSDFGQVTEMHIQG